MKPILSASYLCLLFISSFTCRLHLHHGHNIKAGEVEGVSRRRNTPEASLADPRLFPRSTPWEGGRELASPVRTFQNKRKGENKFPDHLHHSHHCFKPLLLHCLGVLFSVFLLKLEANPQMIRIRIKNLSGCDMIIWIVTKPAGELALFIISCVLLLT